MAGQEEMANFCCCWKALKMKSYVSKNKFLFWFVHTPLIVIFEFFFTLVIFFCSFFLQWTTVLIIHSDLNSWDSWKYTFSLCLPDRITDALWTHQITRYCYRTTSSLAISNIFSKVKYDDGHPSKCDEIGSPIRSLLVLRLAMASVPTGLFIHESLRWIQAFVKRLYPTCR